MFYKDKLEAASPRDMFRILKGPTTSSVRTLPTRKSDKALADEAQFFQQEVAKNRATLDSAEPSELGTLTSDTQENIDIKLTSFKPVTEINLRKLIGKAPSKSCHLDPAPIWLIKDDVVMEAVIPAPVSAINGSLESGVAPASPKTAVVTYSID